MKKTDEICKLSAQVTTTEKVLKDKYNKLKGKIKKCINSGESNFNRLNGKLNQGMNLITNCQKNIDQVKEKIDDQIDAMENVIKDNFNTLNDKINNEAEGGNLINDPQKEIANLKHHVNNIENILFCNSSDGSKDVLLQWKLQNYQYHFDIGEPVCSPIFLTQIEGYCFKLFVKWSGENKEYLGLFFKVCCGSNYDKPLEPFRIPYSLEMVDNNGNISSRKIPLSSIEANKEENFTLPPGKSECTEGFGFHKFISMPDLNNYILNDMLSIQCRLTPL